MTRLTKGPAVAGDLAAQFDISAPAVSRHLRVLEEAGLVTRTRRHRYHVFTLQVKALRAAEAWLRETGEFWESQLGRFDEYLDGLPE